jgi:hypothetical protein
LHIPQIHTLAREIAAPVFARSTRRTSCPLSLVRIGIEEKPFGIVQGEKGNSILLFCAKQGYAPCQIVAFFLTFFFPSLLSWSRRLRDLLESPG